MNFDVLIIGGDSAKKAPFAVQKKAGIIIHQKLPVTKQRIQLKNIDYKVKEGICVAGVSAGYFI